MTCATPALLAAKAARRQSRDGCRKDCVERQDLRQRLASGWEATEKAKEATRGETIGLRFKRSNLPWECLTYASVA
jgi:hypothetical protein